MILAFIAPSPLSTRRAAALAVPSGFFVVSCFLTAGFGRGGFLEDGFALIGLQLLLMAWTGILFYFWAALAWLANPLGIAAFGCLWHRKEGAGVILAGMALAASLVPLFSFAPWQAFRLDLPLALVSTSRIELRLGYFVWGASHGLLFACTILFWCFPQRGPNREQDATSSQA